MKLPAAVDELDTDAPFGPIVCGLCVLALLGLGLIILVTAAL